MANQKVYSISSPGSPAILVTSSPPTSSSSLKHILSPPKCVYDLLLEFPDVLSSDGFTASPTLVITSTTIFSPSQVLQFLQILPPGPWQISYRQGWVLCHGKTRHHALFYLSLGVSSSYGQEEGPQLETLPWLSAVKHRHCTWLLPSSKYCWFYLENCWIDSFL